MSDPSNRSDGSDPSDPGDPGDPSDGGPAARRGDAPGPVCAFCGATPPDDGHAPLTWTTAVERGRTRMFCDGCSREHLRAIEGKLDSAWW